MELTPFEKQQRYDRAKKKAQNIRSFYMNLALYCIVIPILIIINLTYMPEFHWFYFSMLGWGTGLFFHAMEAFEWNPFFGKNWEERKIRELMDKQKNQNTNTK